MISAHVIFSYLVLSLSALAAENKVITKSMGTTPVGAIAIELFQISSREGRCSIEVSDLRGLAPKAQAVMNARFQRDKKLAYDECRAGTDESRYSSTESIRIVDSFIRISSTGEVFTEGAVHASSWVDSAFLYSVKDGSETKFDEASRADELASCAIRALFKGGPYDGDSSLGKTLTLDVDKTGEEKVFFVLRQPKICTTCTETVARLPLPRYAAEKLLKPEVFSMIKPTSMPTEFEATGDASLDAALKACFIPQPPPPASTPTPTPSPTASPTPEPAPTPAD